MVVGRTLQGFVMGAIALGLSIMRGCVLLVEHVDWHVLFCTMAGIGLLVMALTMWVVPQSPPSAPGGLDLLGAVGLSAGLVALLLPISKGGDWGWASTITLGLFSAAVVILRSWGALDPSQTAAANGLNSLMRSIGTSVSSAVIGTVLAHP